MKQPNRRILLRYSSKRCGGNEHVCKEWSYILVSFPLFSYSSPQMGKTENLISA